VTWVAEEAIRWSARMAVQRIDLRSEGLENLPRHGPVLLAARHYHHFWDGCALLAAVPRPLHVVVTLDWMTSSSGRRVMTRLCQAVDWPVVERTASPSGVSREASAPASSRTNRAISQRAPVRSTLDLLGRNRAVLIFPEAYPTIDPHGTPKTREDEFLPFRPGVLHLAVLSARETGVRVPIVPVGLNYQRSPRWSLRMRFGEPHWYEHGRDRSAQLRNLEEAVRRLSGITARAAHPEDFALTTGWWPTGAH
jgi:putative membrane protein